jgi:integrase
MRLFKRGDVWHFSFSVAGRRRRQSTGARDRRVAERIAAEIENRQRLAHHAGPQAVLTFGEAAALYMEAGKSRRFLAPLLHRLAVMCVADIAPALIRRLAGDLYPDAGPATRNRQAIGPAQAVINHAAGLGLCQAIRVRRFAVTSVERPAGDWNWALAFARAANGLGRPALGALAVFLFTTGARIGQACALRWRGVDLARAEATIAAAKRRPSRLAHLVPEAVAAIASIPGDRDPDERVFGFVSRHAVQKPWAKAVKAADLPWLTTHEAGRHGFGTQMIVRANVDPVSAARLGGWASPRVLLDTYAKGRTDPATVAAAFKRGNDR